RRPDGRRIVVAEGVIVIEGHMDGVVDPGGCRIRDEDGDEFAIVAAQRVSGWSPRWKIPLALGTPKTLYTCPLNGRIRLPAPSAGEVNVVLTYQELGAVGKVSPPRR